MNALVMYDHQTDTLWSQFLSRGVKGSLENTLLEVVPALQTTWQQWLGLHPDTFVLDKQGRYQSDRYEGYYRRDSAGILGETNKDGRLPRKDLVLGVVLAGTAKAYPFQAIADETVINDSLAGNFLLVTFDPISETAGAFDRRVEDRYLTFQLLPKLALQSINEKEGQGTLIEEGYPGEEFLMTDQETGSTWQALTGRAINGPLAGTALKRLPSLNSFWFAWSDFHPGTELFEVNGSPN